MRRFEMDVFEEMDAITDDFFTEWEKVTIYEEPEEEEEEEEEPNPWALTEEEENLYNKYDDERGAWDL